MSNYPDGAEHDPRAPWNDDEAPEVPADLMLTTWGRRARLDLCEDMESELWWAALDPSLEIGSRQWMINVQAMALIHYDRLKIYAEKLWRAAEDD